MINECNQQCGCENLKYAPVCLEESGLTFYTACHAGCSTVTRKGAQTVSIWLLGKISYEWVV